MPIIEATITEGREPESIRALIHELTAAVHRALEAPIANIRIIVREVPPSHFAAGDVTITERRQQSSGTGSDASAATAAVAE